MLQGRLAVWSFTGIAVFVVVAVVVVLASVFAPRPTAPPSPTPPDPPTSSADRIHLQAGFRAYLETHIAETPQGGTPFCTWDLLGHADTTDGVDAYIWAHCEEFVAGDGFVVKAAATVVPVVLHTREGPTEDYDVEGHSQPGGAERYEADVRRLFPSSLHGRILGPGAVGSFPSIVRIRALEAMRLPLRYMEAVEVSEPRGTERELYSGTHVGVDWSLHTATATATDGGRAVCIRFTSSPPPEPTPEDIGATGDSVCVRKLEADIRVSKVSESIVLDDTYSWTFGQATGADEIEVVFGDQRRETLEVREGVWVVVYDSFRYPEGVIARREGRTIGGCGIEGYRGC